jgi:hypothetical protein
MTNMLMKSYLTFNGQCEAALQGDFWDGYLENLTGADRFSRC